MSKWMDKWMEQARQQKELEKEKLELSEALLEKMKALKKAMEDVSSLRNIILERQSTIDMLWPQEVQNIEEKLEL